MGQKSLSEGITNIFVKELKKYTKFTRPLHCSDAKREVMHIKCDDGWKKDIGNIEFKKSISTIKTKNRIMFKKHFSEVIKNYNENENKNENEYEFVLMKLANNINSPFEKEDLETRKIEKNIVDSVFIKN